MGRSTLNFEVPTLSISCCHKMSETQPTLQASVNPIIINLPPIDPKHEKEAILKSFPKRTMICLSILQIICGWLAFLFQVIQYIVGSYYYSGIYVVGWGIWTGIIFAASGLVGLIGAFRPSKCMMISFLVLNIISSAFTLCLIVPESIGIAYSDWYRSERANLALYCLLLIIGLAQAVVSIIAAGYSCSAVCCRQNQNYPATVIFTSDPTTANQSTFVPVALNVETPTSSERNDQNSPTNYEEVYGNKYQRF